ATLHVVAVIGVGNHPSAMLFGGADRLFVADSNSDAVSVIEIDRNREVQRISISPYDNAQLSSSPEGLAISPDAKTLYVADSGANEVAVVDLAGKDGSAKLTGRIPTAWYPTSVNVGGNGHTLWVTNAKGIGAGPNSAGLNPNPTRQNPPIVDGIT